MDYNYPDCDPGNSSSAESSEGNSSAYVTNNNNIATMSSCRVSRGTSEPPADYHARTGLRKSGCPFKVSGIVMGSQENLASSDDEKSNGSMPPSETSSDFVLRGILPRDIHGA